MLFKLTGHGNVVVDGNQKLPGGCDELRIGEPDLFLAGLLSRIDAVKFLNAAERGRIANRDVRRQLSPQRRPYIVAEPNISAECGVLAERPMLLAEIGVVPEVNPITRNINCEFIEKTLREIHLHVILPSVAPEI